MTLSILVLASTRGSNLRAIAERIDEGALKANIVGVISDRPQAPALEFAQKKGFETRVEPLSNPNARDEWNERLLETMNEFKPDLVVLAGFMRILGEGVVDAYKGRIVNIHPSLLPVFPGSDAPEQAIRAGVRIAGCTVHVVDHGVDSGTILAQAAVPVLTGDTAAILHARIQRAEHRLFPRVIGDIASGRITLGREIRIETPPRLDSQAIIESLM